MSSSNSQRELFGTDGIRAKAGVYPLTPDLIVKLGQAAADAFLARRSADEREWPVVVIGKDTRQSGDMLENAIAAGLNSRGVDVKLAGVIPTPGVAFLTQELNAAFGIVISASHNPFEDNGIKFFGPDGYKLDDDFELEIEHRMLGKGDYPEPENPEIGRTSPLENAVDRYVEFVVQKAGDHDHQMLSGLHIALDCANGASSQSSEAVLRALGAQVSVFHNRPNGININTDCGCTHKQIIEQLVKESGADVGVSHDGDADRVLLCDETGSCLDGDELMAMTAVSMLEEGTLRGNTLVATIMSNLGLDETVGNAGGRVARAGVGDRYVMEVMKEHDYNLGGEQSGHFIFRDYNTTGDGIVSAVRLLRLMRQKGEALSELRKIFIRYPQTQRNVKVSSKPPLEEVASVDALMKEIESELGDKGRILVRYSGTEALLRVLVEGSDASRIEEMADSLATAIEKEIGA